MSIIDLQGVWQAEIAEKKLRFELPLPGDLASALLAAGHIPAPYPGRNELDIQWIGKVDWRAWKSFSLTDTSPGWLLFEGLDTQADIYLNGQKVGSNSNMFTRLCLPVDNELQKGENQLEIRFFSPEHAARKRAEQLPYPVPCSPYADWAPPHWNLLRKVQCHSGWDWGPVLMTSGVYGGVSLCMGRDRIEYVNCSQQVGEDGVWKLGICTEYYAGSAGSVELTYRLALRRARRRVVRLKRWKDLR